MALSDTAYSVLKFGRKFAHGSDATLKLLKLDNNHSLTVLATVTEGFFLDYSKGPDPGANLVKLYLAERTPATPTNLRDTIAVEVAGQKYKVLQMQPALNLALYWELQLEPTGE